MHCLEEVPFEKKRLIDKREKVLQDFSTADTSNKREWQRMKLGIIDKQIREYNRRH
jgi:hypothetical protein